MITKSKLPFIAAVAVVTVGPNRRTPCPPSTTRRSGQRPPTPDREPPSRRGASQRQRRGHC
jgi:hypothetical protein